MLALRQRLFSRAHYQLSDPAVPLVRTSSELAVRRLGSAEAFYARPPRARSRPLSRVAKLEQTADSPWILNADP